ncbi:hypothetical protein J6590_042696 [Homalodisca vitripennis]|nr:hypothetical protein J6590_042696 [Homalodisca vitripennis]
MSVTLNSTSNEPFCESLDMSSHVLSHLYRPGHILQVNLHLDGVILRLDRDRKWPPY